MAPNCTPGNIRSVNVDYFGASPATSTKRRGETPTGSGQGAQQQVASKGRAARGDQRQAEVWSPGGGGRQQLDEATVLGAIGRLAGGGATGLGRGARPGRLGVGAPSPPPARDDDAPPAGRDSTSAKSKSTTLDSGIHTWELASSAAASETRSIGRPEAAAVRAAAGQPHPGDLGDHGELGRAAGGRRRGFSLTRSLSFRPRRPAEPRTRAAAGHWPALSRSRSLRAVSAGARPHVPTPPARDSGAGPASGHQRQATIDYLAGARSARRHSILAFGRDELGGGAGKIALFLRNLFNIRRRRSWRQGARGAEPAHWPAGARPAQSPGARQPGPAHSADACPPAGAQRRPCAANSSCSSSSADSSSPSNSLIEILDCSPAMTNTRRHLREERALRASRATWRQVERPDSSLSRRSDASCSTSNSTASQQLQKHLDEACKRHRKCKSQREKEFIDSINVLRQASRHALQSSRSSSKSRQAKSAASTKSCSATSSAGSDESHHERDPFSFRPNEQRLDLIDSKQPQQCARPECQDRACGPLAHLASAGSPDTPPPAGANSCCACPAPATPPAYLGPALARDLCQLACCPAAGQGALPPLPCCLALQRLGGAASPGAGLEVEPGGEQPAARGALSLAEMPDLCCPVWRSMLLAYCQTFAGHPACLMSAPLPLDVSPHQSQLAPSGHPPATSGARLHQHQFQADRQQQVGSLEGYSATTHQHQVQQHQHNTTIDLKIEIGADFKRKGASRAGSGRLLRVEPAALACDSLESSNDEQSDESLASKELDQRDQELGDARLTVLDDKVEDRSRAHSLERSAAARRTSETLVA